jgi:peptidoglycan/LPS O-acetylase OafA/YrhL
MRVAHPGTYGVMLFFLVSGYIIPASLERAGPRRFWIGRAGRLYPLWAAVSTAAIAAGLARLAPAPAQLRTEPLRLLGANLTMLQGLLAEPPLVNVMWTLTYEMTFYALCTALHRLGALRHSAPLAIGFGVVALTAGGILPVTALSGVPIGVTIAVLAAAWAATLSTRPGAARTGAVVLGLGLLTLLAADQGPAGWEGFATIAVMFAGTVIYRIEQGTITPATATATLITLAAVISAAAWIHGDIWFLEDQPPHTAARIWITATLLAGATFILIRALRHRWTPRTAARIGLISYSVYLLHQGLALPLSGWLTRMSHHWWTQIAAALGFLALLMVGAAASYRWVELPPQRLGRRWRDHPDPGGRQFPPVHELGGQEPEPADGDFADRTHQPAGQHD